MDQPEKFLSCHVPFQILYRENVDVNGFDISRSVVKHINKNYHTGYYHCCGQGNIGLYLLHLRQVDHMHFTDIYNPALEGCRHTTELHNWSASFSNTLIDLKVDLFVADPPWFFCLWPDQQLSDHKMRCLIDNELVVHKQMYHWLPDHLDRDGDAFILGDRNQPNSYDLIPDSLVLCDEYPLQYFAPGYRNIRIINRAFLLHLRHK